MTSTANRLLKKVGSPRPLLLFSAFLATVVFILFLLSVVAVKTGIALLGVFYFFYMFSGFILAALGCVLAISYVVLPPYSKDSLFKGGVAFAANGILIALELYLFTPS